MARAAEILGVAHVWLGLPRLRLSRGRPGDLGSARRTASARWTPTWRSRPWSGWSAQFRPHVMTTYDENGGYPHPDHIRCHVVSVGGVRGGGRSRTPIRTPGEPWQPLKLYYNVGFSRERILAINEAVRERTGDGPVRRMDQAVLRAPTARPGPADHHPGRRSPTSSTPRDAALQGPRDPDRSGFALVRRSARPRGRGLGHRRLRTGQVAGRHRAAGGRPVRRGPGAGGRHERLLTRRFSLSPMAATVLRMSTRPPARARSGARPRRSGCWSSC